MENTPVALKKHPGRRYAIQLLDYRVIGLQDSESTAVGRPLSYGICCDRLLGRGEAVLEAGVRVPYRRRRRVEIEHRNGRVSADRVPVVLHEQGVHKGQIFSATTHHERG